jgi:hypothetical protein
MSAMKTVCEYTIDHWSSTMDHRYLAVRQKPAFGGGLAPAAGRPASLVSACRPIKKGALRLLSIVGWND